MSVKRQATTELNHDNWDQDDSAEHEEMGMFKAAPKDVLEKRVIRTAKRRVQPSGDDAKKNVFSGFGGFNKTQPSSFDFLANLTNGSKSSNGTSTAKVDSPAPSAGLFSSKPPATSNSSPFSTPVTSTSKPAFGSSIPSGSLFSNANATTSQSAFGSKTETTLSGSPFKMQTSVNPTISRSGDIMKTTTTTFGSPSKSPFSNNNTNTLKTANAFGSAKSSLEDSSVKNDETKDKSEEKKMKYYGKLKGLNESVSDWIKKHVEETPLCILSPIFKDYEKYLKEIQDEYHNTEENTKNPSQNNAPEVKATSANSASTLNFTNNTGSSLFSSANAKPSVFANQTNATSTEKPLSNQTNMFSSDKPSSGFSFGTKTSAPTTSSGGFSFGISSAPQTTTESKASFSFANTNSGSNPPAPFSFSNEKPFSFSSNIAQKPAETAEEKDDEDEPPKVEYTPMVEENSVFDKKCKIFVKKDGNFADKGVGTLYIKKIEESGKHQLLVRANTSLGNVLLNFILASSIPTQRLGKNNVMLVCIPTPDAKPPPTPVLIRVKTSEEADELLETLNKYKV